MILVFAYIAFIAAIPKLQAQEGGSPITLRQQRTDAAASIRDDRGAFSLQTTPNGLLVVESSPHSFWMLTPGDIIATLDTQPVHTPEDFYQIFRGSSTSSLSCQIRREGKLQVVKLSTQRYQRTMPPVPPAPPTSPSR